MTPGKTPGKDRVQLSADELQMLLYLVWDQIRDRVELNEKEAKLAVILVKLERSYSRARATARL